MGRNRELDALRGLAATTIVFYHIFVERVGGLLRFGWVGVDLFFVLSGYLITSILLREQGAWRSLPGFHLRRIVRIWPIYFLALGAYFVVELMRPGLYRLDAWPYYLTFTQNVPRYWNAEPPSFGPPLGHTWTLAVEQQFYLLWPFVVILSGRHLATMAVAVAAGSVVARAEGLHPWLLLGRCDGFALGGLLAALLAGPRPSWLRPALWAAGVAAAAALAAGTSAFGLDFLGEHMGTHFRGDRYWVALILLATNVLSLAVVGLVATASGSPALGFLRLPPLVYLGQISYGLYLYHLIILNTLARFGPLLGLGPAAQILATLLGSPALAALSWHFFERPILDRFRRRAVPAAGGVAPTPTLDRPEPRDLVRPS